MNNTKKIKTPVAIITIIISILMLTGVALAEHTHEQSAVWENTGETSFEVGQDQSLITTITITNESGDPIDNIQIVNNILTGATKSVPAEENFYTAGSTPTREITEGVGPVFIESSTTETIALDKISDGATTLNVVDLYDESGSVISTGDYTVDATRPADGEIDITNDLDPDNFTVARVTYNYDTDYAPTGGDKLTLPAGTELQLNNASVSVVVYENTKVRINEDNRLWMSSGGEVWATTDNETLEFANPFTGADSGTQLELDIDDNFANVKEKTFDFGDTTIRLTEETQVITTGDAEVVQLSSDTEFELLTPATLTNIMSGDENVKTLQEKTVKPATPQNEDNPLRAVYDFDVTHPTEPTSGTVHEGDQVYAENVIVENGTTLGLTGTVDAEIAENTPVVRGADNELEMENANAATGMPEDWDSAIRTGHYVFDEDYLEYWPTGSDYTLDSGDSLDVPIALTSGSDDANVRVRTTDTSGTTRQTTLTLEVDTTNPEVKDLSVSPKFASENVEVSLEIEFSEALSVAPDVKVTELSADNGENIDLTTDNNNLVYEGTYTTGDNAKRDGAATILIENFEDEVGNEGGPYESPGGMFTVSTGVGDLNLSMIETADNYLFIDRAEPFTPSLKDIHGWPEDETAAENNHTDKTSYLWEDTAEDNMRTYLYNTTYNYNDPVRFDGTVTLTGPSPPIPDYDVPKAPLIYGNVEVLYKGEWHSLAADEDGYWSTEEELPDGRYEIGLRYTDLSGNTSTENLENFVIDDTSPTIDLTTDFDDKGYINDNQPEISLEMSDAGIGIENEFFIHDFETLAHDNSGYAVMLASADFANNVSVLDNKTSTPIENMTVYNVDEESEFSLQALPLRNTSAHDRNNLEFLNTLENVDFSGSDKVELELTDGSYGILALAGDNLQGAEKAVTFTVDTVVPEIDDANIDTYPETPSGRKMTDSVTDESDLTFSGDAAEKGSTIRLYEGGPDGTLLGETTLANDTKEWEITGSLAEGLNAIYMVEEDRAGNVSEEYYYGDITVDTEKPTIEFSQDTLDKDGTETSRSTLLLEATITDGVADYNQIATDLSGTGYYTPESGVTIAEDGTISREIPLREGFNTITLIAEDDAGNRAVKTITITRTVTPWTMYATIAAIIAIILAAIAILRRT